MSKTIVPLFSDVVYINEIVIDPINLDNIQYIKNAGNLVSDSIDILDQTEFQNLRISISNCLHDFFYNELKADNTIGIRITDSWINKSTSGSYHHQHNHSNSIFSGVVFLEYNDPGNSGRIKFQSSKHKVLDFDVYEQNILNSTSYAVVPKKGKILIFPSELLHSVEEYKSNTPRISLSFNTFLTGRISDIKTRSLKLN